MLSYLASVRVLNSASLLPVLVVVISDLAKQSNPFSCYQATCLA